MAANINKYLVLTSKLQTDLGSEAFMAMKIQVQVVTPCCVLWGTGEAQSL